MSLLNGIKLGGTPLPKKGLSFKIQFGRSEWDGFFEFHTSIRSDTDAQSIKPRRCAWVSFDWNIGNAMAECWNSAMALFLILEI